MSNSFSETTSVSWFGRMKRSVGGLAFGLVLVVGMVVLLFWNEGRAVQTARSLAEGAASVVSVPADRVDPANDGRLIHVSGRVTSTTVPADADFGISQESIRLIRTVEMYQWKESSKSETKTKVGGGEETVTTYTYSKGWDDDAIDSSRFKQPAGHSNPPMEIRSRTIQIPEGELGAFVLDEPVLRLIGGNESLPLAADKVPAIDAAYGGSQRVSVVDGRIHLGQNPTSPVLGDYRITYQYVPIGVISIVARQAGTLFTPYQTVAGDELMLVQTGDVPADQIFADAMTENTIVTWVLRLAGLLFLVIGFALVLSPLGVVADFIPFLGSIVRMGTGFVALLLGVLVGTTTIAIAWFVYRPVVAVGILLVGGLLAAGLVYFRRRRLPAGSVTGSSHVPPSATATSASGSKW